MVNKLEFRFFDPKGKEKWADDFEADILKATRIFLDGKELVEILKGIEYPFAEKNNEADLAGAYGHLSPSELLENLEYSMEHPDYEAELLCCSGCGDSGCWSISVQIRCDDDFVYWDNFRHNHRNWEYDLSFKFDTMRYKEQLKLLSDNI